MKNETSASSSHLRKNKAFTKIITAEREMNILIINHYAGSQVHGMVYRPFYLARNWVRLGHKVTIVAASYSHLRKRQPRLNNSAGEEYIQGVRYYWLNTPQYTGNGFRRILNMLAFLYGLNMRLKSLCSTFNPHVIISSNTYLLDIYCTKRVAGFHGAKLIFEVRDLWPLTPMQLRNISRWNPIIRILQHAEDFAYKNANLVVSVIPDAQSYMLERGLAPGKFNYIPNGVDLDEWDQLDQSTSKIHKSVIEEAKQKYDFLIGFTGAMGEATDLETLIRAAKLPSMSKVAVILVGNGPLKSRFERIVAKENISNVKFLPSVEKQAMPQLLDLFDACYIGLKESPLFKYGVSPNKLFDYMMASKPVVSALSTPSNPVELSGCGISVPPEAQDSLASGISELMSMSEEQRKQIGALGRSYVKERHNYKVLANKFLELMNN